MTRCESCDHSKACRYYEVCLEGRVHQEDLPGQGQVTRENTLKALTKFRQDQPKNDPKVNLQDHHGPERMSRREKTRQKRRGREYDYRDNDSEE